MGHPCVLTQDDDLSREELARFQGFVASKCPAHMNSYDREDLASDIMLDALLAHRKTGIPLVALAFTLAKRPRYYGRASGRVKAAASELADDGVADETQDGSDPVDVICHRDLLERLPERQRRAFQMQRIESATIEETAEFLGCSLSTARREARRADDLFRRAWLSAVAA